MKKLQQGSKAIRFEKHDLDGNIVSLDDFKGQKVLLAFFRKAACPFCNMAIRELILAHDELERKGIKVIALFASSKEDVEKYAGKQNPPFPIIPDKKFSIYKKYGIDVSYIGMMKTMFNPVKIYKAIRGGFFSLKTTTENPVLPAEILIDEHQIIHRAYYGKNFDDHLPISEIIQWNK